MIEVRSGRDGARVYRARVYHRGRYVASRTFARKRDAQEWERRQVDGLRSGVWSDPGAAERPVQDWCDAWLAAQPPRAPATERKIREAINKRIAKGFGRRPAISVRPSEVGAWCSDLARAQSSATARHSLGVLRRVFDYAVQDGAIPRNPATGIRLPKVQGNEPQPLTHTELWQLAEQFDSRRDRVLIVVAGYCGLRWGELAALRWTDIDLDLAVGGLKPPPAGRLRRANNPSSPVQHHLKKLAYRTPFSVRDTRGFRIRPRSR